VTAIAAEVTKFHTRLLKCDLCVDECRAYWGYASQDGFKANPETAFSDYWFGARSLPRVRMLLATLRERFDAWPEALKVLADWHSMSVATRRTICHWHLQLADPLYRKFTGEYLPQRRDGGKSDVRRTLVVQWIDQLIPGRWQITTRIQFARKLIHSAEQAGLLNTSGDTAELQTARVDDNCLTYLFYLLRDTQFEGTLLSNPYLKSTGLDAEDLVSRRRCLPAVGLQLQGNLTEFNWQHDSLSEWAAETGLLTATSSARTGEVA
jgi:hypothetical protein